VEGCFYVSILLSVFLSLRAGSNSFRYQMVWAIYLEIITPHLQLCCVIYDLEGSYDAYPQDANLTFVGKMFFL
jgi:hypothetical protein